VVLGMLVPALLEIFELNHKPVDHYNPGLKNNALIKLKSSIQVGDIIRKKIIDK
jgi:hypothetical protein